MKQIDWKKKSLLGAFASYYRPHWKLFVLDLVCALCIALVDLAFPTLSRYSMQQLLPGKLFQAFFAVMAILVGAYIVRGVLYYIVAYWGHLLGVEIEADIRRDLFCHLQEMSCRFYDKERTGELLSRITGDLFEISELAHHGPEDLFISIVTLIGAFIMMVQIRWELAVTVFAVVPLFLIFTVVQRRRMGGASMRVKRRLGNINGQVETSLTGMRTAKAFANEEVERERFTQSNEAFRHSKKGYYHAMAVYHSGLEFSMSMMHVLVIALGGFLIMQEKLTYVDLITFSLYISTFLTPVRKLGTFVEQFTQGTAGFRRFLSLMQEEPDLVDAPDATEMGEVRGDIRIQDVSFRYEEQMVLTHINLHIQPGETVAVVGPSGGGKSTLCQLIPRFYDVTQGAVLVDGTDGRRVTQQSLRRQVGMVQQDVFLFAGTVYDNILYGSPTATEGEIIAAAKRAEIYEDIMAMPQGFQTQVGERGVMLSGGQKQRISIARIFLKNPPVLILDEATSALDSVTEAKIQSALESLCQGRTTLIIAHRLSTVRGADRILVLDENHILEEGTHRELLEKQGAYWRLWTAQEGRE